MNGPKNDSVKLPLAIVGASTRSAAASAVRSGFQPIVADLFADADLRRIATATRISPYPEGLVDWMRAIEPAAWVYTGALENYPELVDQMAWIAPLLGNSGDVLQLVRSPWELADALRRADFLFPETRSSFDGLPVDGSWLRKTYSGASGSGVRSLGPAVKNAELDDDGSAIASSAVYQQRVPGVPCAAVYVARNGTAAPIGITRQLIGEAWLNSHGFQYAGSIGPYSISEATQKTLVRLGDWLALQFDLVGLFGVDFMLDGDDVWTLEVNPRYTASVEIVERYSGVRAIGAHVEICGGAVRVEKDFLPWAYHKWWSARPAANGDPGSSHGKAILFARQRLTISERFAEFTLFEAIREPWPTLADVSPAGTVVEKGRPVLTIFAEGANVDEVTAKLRARSADIEALLYNQ
jgi:uncharacterized protein